MLYGRPRSAAGQPELLPQLLNAGRIALGGRVVQLAFNLHTRLEQR
jgi:hypothetical protein